MLGNLSDPQSFNKYAYIGNNPLNGTDPTGYFRSGTGGGWDWTYVYDDFNSDWIFANATGYWELAVTKHLMQPSFPAQTIFEGENSVNFPGPGLGATVADILGITPPDECEFRPCSGGDLGIPAMGFGGGQFGIRNPGQTYGQCLATNSGNYSINHFLPSGWQGAATKFALGNDVANALFGDANEGTFGLAVGAGAAAPPLATGVPLTVGRRTSSIFSLNLPGTPGGPKGGFKVLEETGAKKVVGWLSGAFELKLAADVGATAAEALNCIAHR